MDGVIADPSKCKFDPSVLLCSGPDADNCLTRPQVETVRKLYAGPANPRTGERIYPGIPRGSEFGWERLGASPATATEPLFAPIFKWAFGPQWDWRSFDFDGSAAPFVKKLAGTVNAMSPNLDGFRSRGGKLILYHGWADWVRLFMLPGMAHCSGEPGADQFDPLSAIVCVDPARTREKAAN
jgi:feruloyl esterase